MPALIAASLSPNLLWIESRSTKREVRNASVAPSEEAKETITVPHTSPKMAPATSVMIAAPGSDKPVTATYAAKNIAAVVNACAA